MTWRDSVSSGGVYFARDYGAGSLAKESFCQLRKAPWALSAKSLKSAEMT
jgi:hypothetical protein